MRRKLNRFFWGYIGVVLAFNDLLGLFIPKLVLRGIYIIIMFFIIIMNLYKDKFGMVMNRSKGVMLIFISFLAFRFVLQFFLGNKSSITMISFIQLIVPMIAFFLAVEINDIDAMHIERIFCICAAVSILLGFIDSQFKFLPKVGAFSGELYAYIGTGNVVRRGYSMAGSALSTGFIGALAAVFCIGEKTTNFKHAWLKNVIFSISLLGCLLSYSRGAIAFFIITEIIYLYKYYKNNQGGIKKKHLAVALIIFSVILLLILLNYKKIMSLGIIQRVLSIGNNKEASNSKRYIFQIEAMKAILKKPILGYGFGFSGYQAAVNNIANTINPESYVLLLGIDAGIIAAIVFVAIIVLFTYGKNKNNTLLDIKYISIVLGMFAWSIMYILFESDLNAMFLYYCLGRISHRTDIKRRNRE